MSRSLFLFGAGASAFSRDCLPTTPPLGDDLLERMIKDGFLNDGFVRAHGAQFTGPGGFERGMASLTDRYINHQYMGFVREMGRFFGRYIPGPNNLYTELFSKLLGTGSEFGVASLNYETLIERSLLNCGVPVLLDPFGPAQNGALFVVKPHGSCGFLPNPQGVSVWNLQIGFPVDVDVPTFFTVSPETIDEWCLNPLSVDLAPAMSFYSPYKETRINPKLIMAHRQLWQKLCARADKVFVVGVRYNEQDPHVWDPLRLPNKNIIFVNPSVSDAAAFAAWAQEAGVTAELLSKGLEDAMEEIVARVAA
jgi:hypothetical protein